MAKKSQIFRDQCFSHPFDYVNEEFGKKMEKIAVLGSLLAPAET